MRRSCVGVGVRPVRIVRVNPTFSFGSLAGRKVAYDRGVCSGCGREVAVFPSSGLVARHGARRKMDCPDCMRLLRSFSDIPETLARTRAVWEGQYCRGAHTLDAWVEDPM